MRDLPSRCDNCGAPMHYSATDIARALADWNEELHPRADDGKFTSGAGGGSQHDAAATTYKRPVPIRVKSLDEAVDIVLKGKVVELPQTGDVNTLIDRLANIAKDALARGEKAPDYDLCNVTVKGTNLFCESRVVDGEHPNGIPRVEMPQFEGEAEPGSDADKLPRKGFNNAVGTTVNAGPAFLDHLKSLGIPTKHGTVSAATLKASQAELGGQTVGYLMTQKLDFDSNPIWVSRDFYVIDGHHRWAAAVGQDARDGHLGDSKVKVVYVDAPISEILHLANSWTAKFGIKKKAAKK